MASLIRAASPVHGARAFRISWDIPDGDNSVIARAAVGLLDARDPMTRTAMRLLVAELERVQVKLFVCSTAATLTRTHTYADIAVDIDSHATYREHEAAPRNKLARSVTAEFTDGEGASE